MRIFVGTIVGLGAGRTVRIARSAMVAGNYLPRRMIRCLDIFTFEHVPETGGKLPIGFDQESTERFEVVGPFT